jgi:hypothetical protein
MTHFKKNEAELVDFSNPTIQTAGQAKNMDGAPKE